VWLVGGGGGVGPAIKMEIDVIRGVMVGQRSQGKVHFWFLGKPEGSER